MRGKIIVGCIGLMLFQNELLSLGALLVITAIAVTALLKAAAKGGVFD